MNCNFYLCIYPSMPLSTCLFRKHLKSLLCIQGTVATHLGSGSLTRDQTRPPLHWKLRVLATGPPGKSLFFHIECTVLCLALLLNIMFLIWKHTSLSHQEIEVKITAVFHNIQCWWGRDAYVSGVPHTPLVKNNLVNHSGKWNGSIY